jgi:hypothetical protein
MVMQRGAPIFDQRNQQVRYQWNAAGDINVGAAKSQEEVAAEIEKLSTEVRKAAEAGILDEEQATEAEYSLKRAHLAARKPEGNKGEITKYLSSAKEVVKDISALSGLFAAIGDTVQKVSDLF